MKISKWIEKLDIVYFFVFGLAFFIFMSQTDIGTLNKSMITFLCIPIYLDLLKKIIDYRIKSSDAEIDIRGAFPKENCIIWKEDDRNTYQHFVTIKNKGNVIIQKVLVKIQKKYNCGEFNFEVNVPINPADEIVVGIPFEYSEIESIWISGYLKYEKITKQFYGDISECEGQYIWAEEKYFYGEKYCLKHKEKKEAKFVRLKKYWFQEHSKDNT